jgi:hypothetical protein
MRRAVASLLAVPLVALAACSESNRSKAEGAVEDWVEELDLSPEQEECMRGVVADFTDEQLDTIQGDSDELDAVNLTDPAALENASDETQQFYAGIGDCVGTPTSG